MPASPAVASPEMALTLLGTYDDAELSSAMRRDPDLLDRLHRLASEQLEALESDNAQLVPLDDDGATQHQPSVDAPQASASQSQPQNSAPVFYDALPGGVFATQGPNTPALQNPPVA